jgi:hypothetical protein
LKARRRIISRQDVQYVIVFVIISTVVASTVAYAYLNPARPERFFAMWILGSEGLAEHYYPNDNPNLVPGQFVNWTLGVYNHMNSLQYVVVRVKLLNSTITSPNDTSGTPSPSPPLLEFRRVLIDNDTWSFPFTWKISNYTIESGSVLITGLTANQTLIQGNFARAVGGHNFRLVFELWFYDSTTQSLVFSSSDSEVHSAWSQIWFNATMT